MSSDSDRRLAVFLDPNTPDLFHAVVHTHDVWKSDQTDVELIHSEARAAFRQLVERALRPDTDSGRVLLILGESGSGKTHLMRWFHSILRSEGNGLFAYLRTPVEGGPFARHLLHHVVESLERDYDPPAIQDSGLKMMSNRLLHDSGLQEEGARERIQGDDFASAVTELTDRLLRLPQLRSQSIDDEIVRILLLLQRDDPPLLAKILRYLRGHDLSPADRLALGVTPLGPDRVLITLRALARVMTAFQPTVFVIAVDQLDDVTAHSDPPARLREVLAVLAELAETPNVVVVVGCLSDTYDRLCDRLPAPLRFRIEHDPEPVRLVTERSLDEVTRIVSMRLAHLYYTHGVAWDAAEPTSPLPPELLESVKELPTRLVLDVCRRYRERCVAEGRLVEPAPIGAPSPKPSHDLESIWHTFRVNIRPPDDYTEEDQIRILLAETLKEMQTELPPGLNLEVGPDSSPYLQVIVRTASASDPLLIGVCNKNTVGGGLGKQLEQLERAAAVNGSRPVVVRSSDFPSSGKTKVGEKLDEIRMKGGRVVRMSDADLQTLWAMKSFTEEHRSRPDFASWRSTEKPTRALQSISDILNGSIRQLSKHEF